MKAKDFGENILRPITPAGEGLVTKTDQVIAGIGDQRGLLENILIVLAEYRADDRGNRLTDTRHGMFRAGLGAHHRRSQPLYQHHLRNPPVIDVIMIKTELVHDPETDQ